MPNSIDARKLTRLFAIIKCMGAAIRREELSVYAEIPYNEEYQTQGDSVGFVLPTGEICSVHVFITKPPSQRG